MKKIFVLFLLFFGLPAHANMMGDGIGMCGAYKYDNIYASFKPNEYTCDIDTYLPRQSTTCVACPTGFKCEGGTYVFSETQDQGLIAKEYGCKNGYFLPAASETCAACPVGWDCAGGIFYYSATEFQGLKKFARYMAGNEAGVCAANYAHGIYAVFTQTDYVCNSGYFLPAASETCAACPHGYSCAGGTFHYNAREHQGLTRVATYYTANEANACAANFAHNLNAVFTPNQIEIIWQDAAQLDVTANDARYVTYGTDIRTPANPPHIPGKVFTGWKFIPAQ